MEYINIVEENIDKEHLCCAISDKKHQIGINGKKEWLKSRLPEGHVFRKLDDRGKVFIEYSPVETAWVPIDGKNYFYIYCLWVSGSYKGKGHANNLLNYCIEDAKSKNKSGICVMSSKKKKPFLSDKKFFMKYNFKVIDENDDYQLLGLKFDDKEQVKLRVVAEDKRIIKKGITIFYSPQCPYILNCIKEVSDYCNESNIELKLIPIGTLEEAKNIPCVFNNFAVYINGEFETVHLLNKNKLIKLLEK